MIDHDRPIEDGLERADLLSSLAAQRSHVIGIVAGLDEEQLHRQVLPSGWSALGVIQHLALDVERFWFRAVTAGEAVELGHGDEGWRVPADRTGAAVLDLYAHESALSDAALADRSLDSGPSWWPSEIFPGLPERSLRRTVLHVIAETATHAGHLDAVRELIDGRQWFVLT